MGPFSTLVDPVHAALTEMEGVSLEEMEAIRLQDRRDTKYILRLDQVAELLSELKAHFSVLEVSGTRLQTYDSLYYDTPEFFNYYQHHNGHKNRTKLRFRRYVESNLGFFESKFKTNTGRTVKRRVRLEQAPEQVTEWIGKVLPGEEMGFDPERARPVLQVGFQRITLAGRSIPERATLDIGLRFGQYPGGKEAHWERLAIAELKQTRRDRQSPMHHALHEMGVHPMGLSKYCLGMVETQEGIRKNLFKKKLLKIQRILNPSTFDLHSYE